MMFEQIDVNGDKEHPLYTYLKVPVIILLLYDLKQNHIYRPMYMLS
jgi:glutathione peroxidase-family protein